MNEWMDGQMNGWIDGRMDEDYGHEWMSQSASPVVTTVMGCISNYPET